MGSLQSIIEEQLATMPRIIATELVRDKLKAGGHAYVPLFLRRYTSMSKSDQILGKGDKFTFNRNMRVLSTIPNMETNIFHRV